MIVSFNKGSEMVINVVITLTDGRVIAVFIIEIKGISNIYPVLLEYFKHITERYVSFPNHFTCFHYKMSVIRYYINWTILSTSNWQTLCVYKCYSKTFHLFICNNVIDRRKIKGGSKLITGPKAHEDYILLLVFSSNGPFFQN